MEVYEFYSFDKIDLHRETDLRFESVCEQTQMGRRDSINSLMTKQKRRYPMTLIGLPVDFDTSDKPNGGSGLVIHASAAGLRVQTFNHTPLGKKINIKVSFPKGAEFESFRVEAEIVWKDVYFWEGWEEYQCALKFVESLNGHYLKLKRLLCRLSSVDEAPTRTHNRGASV
jgi:hypothetical protein